MKAPTYSQTSKEKDILSLIKEQHETLRISARVLQDETADPIDKQDHLAQFIALLNIHTQAEEQTIYDVLKDIQASEISALEAIEEHEVAKNLVQELEDVDFRSSWNNVISAKAKVLADIVDHHAREEEKVLFKEARRLLTKDELIALGDEFTLKCKELKEGMDIPLHSPDYASTYYV